ncbi:unnamed protein product [Allacma fusca]|uniref:Uncharacterized protein n=1 Tax=Allacma fusca TaxID=39272 RepID=A0A8J2M0U4_9HEXA|nr:unnamed protein product [Allacma fusca]
MDEALFDGTKLVNKFPSFTSISVVDNIYAALWAGIVQDVEALVDDFIMTEEWDYSGFLKIAESRDIVVLHRSAFSIFPNDKSVVTQCGFGSTRGRHKEQLQAYRRIVGIIFNVAKDCWLEPQPPLPCRNPLVDLKRSIAGLYTLYYMWHNQISSDMTKVPIRYSPVDQMRAKVVGESFLNLEDQIPNGILIKNCYKYLVTSLSKRNAFCYSYIVDEPKIEFQHWQQLHLKNCAMRKTLTAINSSNRFYENIPILDSMCKLLVAILNESTCLATIAPTRSVFFRHMLPLSVAKNAIMIDEKTGKITMKLPFDYIQISDEIAQAMSDNVALIEKPFLTMDALLQTDRAPLKIQGIGFKIAQTSRKKHLYSKKEYEKSKILFNKRCEEQHVPVLKVPRTRKYRGMTKPAWLFITKQFPQIFLSTATNVPENLVEDSASPITTVLPKPVVQSLQYYNEDLTSKISNNIKPSEESSSSSQAVAATRAGTRVSARLRKKPSYLSPYEQTSGKSATPVKNNNSFRPSIRSVIVQTKPCNPSMASKPQVESSNHPRPSTSTYPLNHQDVLNPESNLFGSKLQNSELEPTELLDDIPLVTLESSGDED